MATSVLRRYTPPTCTLEIAATGSVLSRWTDRMVLKNLRFQLSFDDPKLPPDQQITVTGDRLQLEALCEAVETYVQALLNQATHPFSALLAPTAKQEGGSVAASELETAKLPSPPASAARAGIYLKPKGGLAHDLYLGSLVRNEGNAVVHLSTLQLFDLANALEDYHTESVALPSLGRPAWLQSPAGWARVAAIVVLALGATGAVTKFVLDIAAPGSQVVANSGDVDSSTAQRSDANSPLRTLPSPGVASSDLKLDPLFPPKPPTGAIQPEPVPSEATAGLPPTGLTEAPPSGFVEQSPQTVQVPVAASPEPGQVVVVPSPTGDLASNPSGNPTTSPFVDTPPPEALASAAVSPIATGEARTAEPTTITGAAQTGTSTDSQIATNRNTAFDSVPQIAEVRDYFSRTWEPPTELTQTLEYRLVLNTDGTIQRIIPLGEASERFVDRTSMPLMGDPFVTPLQDIPQLQVRLVLSPDGRVQTFPDGN
jgi:hypothetical protein